MNLWPPHFEAPSHAYDSSIVTTGPRGVYKELSIGLTSTADTSRITMAGICAIFVHNYICEHVAGIP